MKSDNQGRIFEIGFNMGILAAFQEKNIGQKWLDLYKKDLEKLRFKKFLKALIERENIISNLDQNIIFDWSQFLLWRGFLGGLNFLREYFQNAGWINELQLKKLEILYFQCSFNNENSFGLNIIDETEYLQDLLTHFGQNVKGFDQKNIKNYVNSFTQKGEFLKADTLILFCYRKKKYRILTVDTSLFSLNTEGELEDINYVELLRNKIVRDINYFRSKSVFSHLRIDTGNNFDYAFSSDLKSYFTAFKYEDKETSKLIQAAGYGWSFINFLDQKTNLFSKNKSFILNAIGYTDRHVSSITVNQDNWQLLNPCYEIYKKDSSEKEIEIARRQVLDFIKRKLWLSFSNGKFFINDLFNVQPKEIKVICHKEKLDNFANTAGIITEQNNYFIDSNYNYNPVGKTLRNAHGDLIKQALVSEDNYIFLTGNPGIGKTTAITEFLKEYAHEGFLFFYVSPRTQVNLDIINKFKKNEGENPCKNLFCINTDRKIIDSNDGKYTVNYFSNQINNQFTKNNVYFIPQSEEELNLTPKYSQTTRQDQETITTGQVKSQGVIDSICQGIYALIDDSISDPITNQIVASVSIQSLKKTRNGHTLEHFGNIFKGAYNSNSGVIPEKMQAIAQRIKHIFIMIDEITGDNSGVDFLHGIKKELNCYELLKGEYGFNTKIIVADASLVDKNVIKQHLEDNNPDSDKIFFRKTENSDLCLTVERFEFNKFPATIINTNSYPANSLNLTYKVILDSALFQEKETLKFEKDRLQETFETEIIKDIEKLYDQDGQILVYIQNKQQLQELINELKNKFSPFEKNQQYLEVHANLSQKDKKEIPEYQHKVKIIFMTSSGSRGLSFPLVKHILVNIPRFQIENNLMEIIQVIYRGRGDNELDQQDKQLIFYLVEKSLYYQDDKINLSLNESKLNVVNILLLLKAAILTRIKGSGKIANDHFLIIPIGGKSISSAGESFTIQLSNLLRELKKEYQNKPSHKDLEKAKILLEKLLSNSEFKLTPCPEQITSYLTLREKFPSLFLQLIEKSFDNLLSLNTMEFGYILGNLLIVSTNKKNLQETYSISLDKINQIAQELLETFKNIAQNKDYHDNLRFDSSKAIDLLKHLTDNFLEKSQKFQQISKKDDEYYAIPLFIFLAQKILTEYLSTESEKEIQDQFRFILEQYIRQFYPVNNMLPLSANYADFPWILFSCYSFNELRNNLFKDQYLFNSNELNIINLLFCNH